MFNRIVAATDLVTISDAPVISAARMARAHGARLFLLHVMESASLENRRLVRHFMTDLEMTSDVGYENELRQVLETTYRDSLADLPHEVRISAGFPWEEILRLSRLVDTDLIVLGPHSTRAEEKGVIRTIGRVGSTVENVITRETCPVMVVNRPADVDRLLFRRVLVAVDFSRSCESAIRFAVKLAASRHSRLIVFHMLPVPPFPKYTRSDYMADEARARQRIESFYEDSLSGVDYRYLIRAGAMPHLEILKAVEENRVDLIVMGSHTKERPGKWYPGSAVERVCYRTAGPVIVITDPTALKHWQGSERDADRQDKDRLIHLFGGKYH